MGKSELYVILPIFNKSIAVSAPLPIVLSDDLVLRNMEDGEKRLITENAPSVLAPNGKMTEVFVLTILPTKDDTEKSRQVLEDTVQLDSLCIQTIFNMVSSKGVISIPYGIVIEKGTIPKIKYIYDFGVDYLTTSTQDYNLLPAVTVSEVNSLISIARKTLKTDKALQITFKRFCSSFLKTSFEDKLIDLTIALESLIPASTEISFQFSLYLSLVIAQDTTKREEVFYKLRDLYKARSGIVHGSSEKDVMKSIKNATDNWDELLDYVKHCIFYRLDFKEKYPEGDWKKHLLSLGLGKTSFD